MPKGLAFSLSASTPADLHKILHKFISSLSWKKTYFLSWKVFIMLRIYATFYDFYCDDDDHKMIGWCRKGKQIQMTHSTFSIFAEKNISATELAPSSGNRPCFRLFPLYLLWIWDRVKVRQHLDTVSRTQLNITWDARSDVAPANISANDGISCPREAYRNNEVGWKCNTVSRSRTFSILSGWSSGLVFNFFLLGGFCFENRMFCCTG